MNAINPFKTAKALCLVCLFIVSAMCCSLTHAAKKSTTLPSTSWVGTWSSAPQIVFEQNNMPPAPGLTNNTFRQIVRVSLGGKTIRLRFSNQFSKNPVTLKSVGVAVSTGESSINSKTHRLLKFNGKKEVVMKPNSDIVSDPLKFNLEPGAKIAITICYGETAPDITGHPASRATSYLLAGNVSPKADFTTSIATDHWYTISGIDVYAPKKAGAVAILGNSIADGRGSGTNKNNRWGDVLSERMNANPKTINRGVLNLGIGGNCVVRGGLGDPALKRFDRDILGQSGVKWLIVSTGVNDIGNSRNEETSQSAVRGVIAGYEEFISKAHEKGIKVYGATIIPFGKSQYDGDHRQMARQALNDWIRNSGKFDAVIDFDKAMRDPSAPNNIQSELQSGDFLHPNEAGYKTMGYCIDVSLFE